MNFWWNHLDKNLAARRIFSSNCSFIIESSSRDALKFAVYSLLRVSQSSSAFQIFPKHFRFPFLHVSRMKGRKKLKPLNKVIKTERKMFEEKSGVETNEQCFSSYKSSSVYSLQATIFHLGHIWDMTSFFKRQRRTWTQSGSLRSCGKERAEENKPKIRWGEWEKSIRKN